MMNAKLAMLNDRLYVDAPGMDHAMRFLASGL